MTHWDDIAATFDLLNLQDFCGGRIRVGYPPAVDHVDVRKGHRDTLSENDCIGRVHATDGTTWTFAIPGAERVVSLPDGTSVLIGDWIVNTSRPKHLEPSPVSVMRDAITQGNRLVLYDFCFVICFDENGQSWKSKGLFQGDLSTVRLTNEKVICQGYLVWISYDLLVLELDLQTGRIIGGDPDAVRVHQKF